MALDLNLSIFLLGKAILALSVGKQAIRSELLSLTTPSTTKCTVVTY